MADIVKEQNTRWNQMSAADKKKVIGRYRRHQVGSHAKDTLEAASMRFLFGEHNLENFQENETVQS